jgi:hypothetical protein
MIFVNAIGNVSLNVYRALSIIGLLGLNAMSAGCALNSDFGRVRPELVSDDMHAWVGSAARKPFGVPPSIYPFTDEERLLRDFAYQIIEPPYERNRWYSVLNEYGLSRKFQPDWYAFDVSAYSRLLMMRPYRSATARYVQLNDDIRNDVNRADAFFDVARRVLDTDKRRQATQANITVAEEAPGSAAARIAENALIVAWVQQALTDKSASYRYALERLVIATPAPMASEVERSIALLNQKIAENQLVPQPLLPIIPVAPRGPLASLGIAPPGGAMVVSK